MVRKYDNRRAWRTKSPSHWRVVGTQLSTSFPQSRLGSLGPGLMGFLGLDPDYEILFIKEAPIFFGWAPWQTGFFFVYWILLWGAPCSSLKLKAKSLKGKGKMRMCTVMCLNYNELQGLAGRLTENLSSKWENRDLFLSEISPFAIRSSRNDILLLFTVTCRLLTSPDVHSDVIEK